MSQNAIVKKVVHPGVVEVSLMRQMECGLSCSSCEGCPQRPKEEILALASDPQGGAKPGDWVEVEPASGSAIGFALLVFWVWETGVPSEWQPRGWSWASFRRS